MKYKEREAKMFHNSSILWRFIESGGKKAFIKIKNEGNIHEKQN